MIKRRFLRKQATSFLFTLLALAGLGLFAGRAWADDARLDQNAEVQWVMGDLSALKTAAQAYYDDHGSRTAPPVSAILNYFETDSLAPSASTLYALKSDGRGWYVGYRTSGLQSETYRLLQDNANSLGLLGDDLRAPWRYGSGYFWAEALTFGSSDSSSGTMDTAVLIAATAALVGIIADNDNDRYYYYSPGYDAYWNSGLVYRPAYYDRFFTSYYRPLPAPPTRFYVPPYRYRAPRIGWLTPQWRHSFDDARRRYDPRYGWGPGYRPGHEPRLRWGEPYRPSNPGWRKPDNPRPGHVSPYFPPPPPIRRPPEPDLGQPRSPHPRPDRPRWNPPGRPLPPPRQPERRPPTVRPPARPRPSQPGRGTLPPNVAPPRQPDGHHRPPNVGPPRQPGRQPPRSAPPQRGPGNPGRGNPVPPRFPPHGTPPRNR